MPRVKYSPMIEQGKAMKALNTRVLTVSNVYTIHKGIVYCRSAFAGIERWFILRDPNMVDSYADLMLNGYTMRGFLAKMKKTKTTVTEDQERIFLGDTEAGSRIEIKKRGDRPLEDILPTFYHKTFVDKDFTDHIMEALKGEDYTDFTEEEIHDIEDKVPCNVFINNAGSLYVHRAITGPLKEAERVRLYPVFRENATQFNQAYNRMCAVIEITEPTLKAYTVLTYLSPMRE